MEEVLEKVLEEQTALERDSSIADTVFRVGNEGNTVDFYAVSALFAVRSPVFKSLLFGRLQEAQPQLTFNNEDDDIQSISSIENHPKKFVRIPDISPKAFSFLRSLFYSQSPVLKTSFVASVAYASKKYFLSHLFKACMDYTQNLLMESTISEFLKVISQFCNYGLKDDALTLVKDSPNTVWNELMNSTHFNEFPLPILKLVLESDDLTIIEEGIWDRCILWAKYQFETKNKMYTCKLGIASLEGKPAFKLSGNACPGWRACPLTEACPFFLPPTPTPTFLPPPLHEPQTMEKEVMVP